MDKQKYWFFGSKLNTVLLLILIILMVIALKWMHQNKDMYFPEQVKNDSTEVKPGGYTQTRDNANGPDYQPNR